MRCKTLMVIYAAFCFERKVIINAHYNTVKEKNNAQINRTRRQTKSYWPVIKEDADANHITRLPDVFLGRVPMHLR